MPQQHLKRERVSEDIIVAGFGQNQDRTFAWHRLTGTLHTADPQLDSSSSAD
jgi:hypothetical protein